VAIAVDFVSFGADLWMGGGSVPGGLYTLHLAAAGKGCKIQLKLVI
jgi:hypothetical protein